MMYESDCQRQSIVYDGIFDAGNVGELSCYLSLLIRAFDVRKTIMFNKILSIAFYRNT